MISVRCSIGTEQVANDRCTKPQKHITYKHYVVYEKDIWKWRGKCSIHYE